jgi:hypothetical protein
MGDVLFTFEIDATPDVVRRALTTSEGIASFWTDRADIPAEVGETLTLGFPEAPSPFDLVLSQSDDKMITWRTATFPPQWVGTDIRWRISGGDGLRRSPSGMAPSPTRRRRAGLRTCGGR